MHSYIITVAAAAASGTENYPYILSLIAVVISLAAILQVAGLRKTLDNKTAAPAPPAQSSAPSRHAAPHAARGDEVTPETIAVIAAAVHSVIGRNRRIVSIKKVDTSWEKSGRQSILTSHRIR